MPIYEYKCSKCKKIIEKYFNSMNVTGIIWCETCNSMAFKIISKSNIHYKGKGFYNTDNKKDNKNEKD